VFSSCVHVFQFPRGELSLLIRKKEKMEGKTHPRF
jgi:hypothetical protein